MRTEISAFSCFLAIAAAKTAKLEPLPEAITPKERVSSRGISAKLRSGEIKLGEIVIIFYNRVRVHCKSY